jgi:hypothetical protein
MGCGTVRRDFHAVRLGTATLIATRSSCGEAMRCTGDQGRFTVTVRVVPADDPDGFGKRAYPGDDRGRLRDSHGHRFHSDAGRGRHHHHRWSRRHHEWQ